MPEQSKPAKMLIFGGNAITSQYDSSVKEIGQLIIEYKETLTKYQEYKTKVDLIKDRFFTICQENEQVVENDLEQDAKAAVDRGAIVSETIEMHRLSGQVKTEYLLDVISGVIKDGKCKTDGWYEFLELKKDFIDHAKSQEKNVQIQSQGYFDVPMYKDGPKLLVDDSSGKRTYMKKDTYTTKTTGEESKLPRVYVNIKKLQDWIKKHPAPAK